MGDVSVAVTTGSHFLILLFNLIYFNKNDKVFTAKMNNNPDRLLPWNIPRKYLIKSDINLSDLPLIIKFVAHCLERVLIASVIFFGTFESFRAVKKHSLGTLSKTFLQSNQIVVSERLFFFTWSKIVLLMISCSRHP